MNNTKKEIKVEDTITKKSVKKILEDVSKDVVKNLQGQFELHHTNSIKAQGAIEIAPQVIEIILKELEENNRGESRE